VAALAIDPAPDDEAYALKVLEASGKKCGRDVAQAALELSEAAAAHQQLADD